MFRTRTEKWPRHLSVWAVSAIVLSFAGQFVRAQETSPPAPQSLSAKIDELIAAGTPDYGAIAAPLSDDSEFLRRVCIDVTGTPPSPESLRAFLAETDPNKRAKKIDELLASPEHPRQMMRVFDVILMRRLPVRYVPVADWQKFLHASFAANTPWDQLARDILSADGTIPAQRGAARFYLDREGEVNQITRDIGRVFLGVNMECAQCHNHPHVPDWHQRDYYGLSAFLVRSQLAKVGDIQVLGEKPEGEVTFESVFEMRDKVSPGPKSTLPRLFKAAMIEEPKLDFGQDAAAQNPAAKPLYSRRARLGEAIASPDNPLFRRAIANRMWAIVMGRGLIDPIEYDHSENPPSHPELLDLLAENIAARGYDLRGFMRDLLNTHTYQLSSRNPSAAAPDTLPAPETFAIAPLRPLSPEQFAQAIMQATGVLQIHREALAAGYSEEALYSRLAGVEHHFANLFGGEPGKPPKGFDASIDQTLFLSNDPMVMSWLPLAGNNTTARLNKFKPEEHRALTEELYLSVLSRPPQEAEYAEVAEYLALRPDDRLIALQELIWALMTSAEFRFQH